MSTPSHAGRKDRVNLDEEIYKKNAGGCPPTEFLNDKMIGKTVRAYLPLEIRVPITANLPVKAVVIDGMAFAKAKAIAAAIDPYSIAVAPDCACKKNCITLLITKHPAFCPSGANTPKTCA
jgi:hypothetical protein